ncbi:ABC transporter substrate-binding protein [Goodfellowiella coeruleoviolacea]|uniref:Probable sugar-binding periplasmic protein n=1 Tax=Goodfellowiella coeruleoviolacea TaxID=334858 RepID=A0AAE3KJV7_9PSEU|nr:ABC transporter substrate-binding protein [Goodfellowiella coeruleoviolacea]MCP2164753.1 carbohydrate ABC transporter substrate-binding protein, CUT1 family [Goodfellowiella coeruleoviolacea]
MRPVPGSPRTRHRTPLLLVAAAGVLATACTAGGGQATDPAGAPAADQQVTVTVWSDYTDRELGVLQQALDAFHASHPNITITNQGGQDDDKITQSIRGGNPPDVAISFATDNIGQFCSSGAWQDLGPYVGRDNVDLTQIPPAVLDYTEFNGVRCAMPMLADVYGLYYNRDMFERAGITAPPRTMSELADYAKRLTVRDPDGTIQVAGFIPQLGFYANHPQFWAPQWGARWVDDAGNSSLATDPAWRELFTWQKELVDFYGWDNLQRFTSGLGQEYSADQGFQAGRVAMAIDGEFRTAFLAEQAPNLRYGTAPAPVADARKDTYGAGAVTGTVIGIPRGARNAGAAWEVVKYLTTDTGAVVNLANGLHNVPTTRAASTSPDLKLPEQFGPFLEVFASPYLASTPTSTIGDQYIKFTEDFANSWQTGQVTDLAAGLAQLDDQINQAKQLGGR